MTTKPTLENVNVSHGKPGQGETPLAVASVMLNKGPVAHTMGVTYDANYTPNSTAFWLRFSDNAHADVVALMESNGWRYSPKNRKAYVHTVNDESILFLAGLGIDATMYAKDAPAVKSKSTETKSTLAPMSKSQDYDKVMEAKLVAVNNKPYEPRKGIETSKAASALSKIEQLKLALAEAEAEVKAEQARKEAEVRAQKEREAKAKTTPAKSDSKATSLAEWDTDKLYAKLEDALSTVNLLIAEIRSRK